MQKLSGKRLVFLGAVGFLSLAILSYFLPVRDVSAQGQGQGQGMNPLEVIVKNENTEPVPVTGNITVGGSSTVHAAQSGAWNVGIVGTVSLDNNMVELIPRGTILLLDSGLEVIGDGAQELQGPVDISESSAVRVVAGAVNGEVRFEVITTVGGNDFVLDQFNLGTENDREDLSRVYELAGQSLKVRLTEIGGPGGANYLVAVFGN